VSRLALWIDRVRSRLTEAIPATLSVCEPAFVLVTLDLIARGRGLRHAVDVLDQPDLPQIEDSVVCILCRLERVTNGHGCHRCPLSKE
jgi:hypothetical protein